MPKVVPFRPPCQEILNELEDIKRRVQRGEITSLIALYDGPECYGRYISDLSFRDIRTFLGLLKLLETDLVRLHNGDSN